GDIDLPVLRLAHIGEILVRQLQDRNPGKIDLVAARQLQQQVERALEAFEIDMECIARVRCFSGRRIEQVLVWNGDNRHATAVDDGERRDNSFNSLSLPSALSNGLGGRTAASANFVRRRLSPESTGLASATSVISASTMAGSFTKPEQ